MLYHNVNEGEKAKDSPITAGEYLNERLSEMVSLKQNRAEDYLSSAC